MSNLFSTFGVIILLVSTTGFDFVYAQQKLGYVSNATSFKEGEKTYGWPTLTNSSIITNPSSGNGFLMNCMSGAHTIFRPVEAIPEEDEIQLYATMYFQEGDGDFGVGFRTKDGKLYLLEIESQTKKFKFYHRPETGGGASVNTVLVSGTMPLDIRNNFGVEMRIQSDNITLSATGNNYLGSAKHSIVKPITHAGFVIARRAIVRAFYFNLHNPARQPKQKSIGLAKFVDFDKDGNLISVETVHGNFDGRRLVKGRVVQWHPETGDFKKEIHDILNKSYYLFADKDERVVDRQAKTVLSVRKVYANAGRSSSKYNYSVIIGNYLTGEKIAEYADFIKKTPKELSCHLYNGKFYVVDNGKSTLYTFDMNTGALLETKKTKIKKMRKVFEIINENQLLYEDDVDFRIHLADINSGKNLFTFKEGDYVGRYEDKLLFWDWHVLKFLDVKTGDKQPEIKLRREQGGAGGFFATKDKNYMLVWGEKQVSLIDLVQKSVAYTQKMDIYDLVVNEDAGVFFVIDTNEKGRLCNLANGELITEVGE